MPTSNGRSILYNESMLFRDLRSCTQQLQDDLEELHAVSNSELSTKLNHISGHLYDLMHGAEPSDDRDSSSRHNWKLYPLAGNIYLEYFLRGIAADNAVLQYYVINLKESVEVTGVMVIHEAGCSPELLLWVLIVGGTVAQAPSDKDWYKAQIGKIREYLALKDWEDARGVLKRFTWFDGYRENTSKSLWNI